MIGDTPYGVVARRTGPSRVATLRGRATHAPGARQPQSHRLGSSSVVDVLVIFSDKFQQSSRTCSRRCTGFSSSTVLDLPVVHRRRGTHSVTVQKTDEIPQMQFLDKVVNTPVGVQIFDNVADVFVVQAWRWSRRAENCGVPQLQFSDKADMPVVVNDRCWRCRFSSSPICRHSSSQQRRRRTVQTVQLAWVPYMAVGAAMKGFFLAFFHFFSRSVHPDVERQVSPR